MRIRSESQSIVVNSAIFKSLFEHWEWWFRDKGKRYSHWSWPETRRLLHKGNQTIAVTCYGVINYIVTDK